MREARHKDCILYDSIYLEFLEKAKLIGGWLEMEVGAEINYKQNEETLESGRSILKLDCGDIAQLYKFAKNSSKRTSKMGEF